MTFYKLRQNEYRGQVFYWDEFITADSRKGQNEATANCLKLADMGAEEYASHLADGAGDCPAVGYFNDALKAAIVAARDAGVKTVCCVPAAQRAQKRWIEVAVDRICDEVDGVKYSPALYRVLSRKDYAPDDSDEAHKPKDDYLTLSSKVVPGPVLLVDDRFTSGSTLMACRSLLSHTAKRAKENEKAAVVCFSLLRAMPDRGAIAGAVDAITLLDEDLTNEFDADIENQASKGYIRKSPLNNSYGQSGLKSNAKPRLAVLCNLNGTLVDSRTTALERKSRSSWKDIIRDKVPQYPISADVVEMLEFLGSEHVPLAIFTASVGSYCNACLERLATTKKAKSCLKRAWKICYHDTAVHSDASEAVALALAAMGHPDTILAISDSRVDAETYKGLQQDIDEAVGLAAEIDDPDVAKMFSTRVITVGVSYNHDPADLMGPDFESGGWDEIARSERELLDIVERYAQTSRVPFSSQEGGPLSLTSLLKKSGLDVRTAQANIILSDYGYLEGETGNWRVAEEGKALGIMEANRVGADGQPYTYIAYGDEAAAMVVDLLRRELAVKMRIVS